MLIACKACHRQYDVEGMKVGDHVRCRCGELVEVPKARPREARVLHCSGCGGKLRENSRKCDYCSAEITLAERNMGPACPECFARLPGNARFCNDCGVEIRPEAIRTTSASAACPRCKGGLILRELPKCQYTECGACGGIWLDAASFERVLEEKDTAALASVFRPAGEAQRDRALTETIQYVPCPVCGSLMHRKNFGGCSGVVVDWCKGHGFWFDALELEKVIAFVDAGGLDRARQREIQRAKEEIARLDQQRKAARAHPGRAAWRHHDYHGPNTADWAEALGKVGTFLWDLVR